MRSIALAVCLTLASGCSPAERAPGVQGAGEEQDPADPAVRFMTMPLLPTAERPAERFDSVWSQNDDRDAIIIVLSGNGFGVLPMIDINLIGRGRLEGDGRVDVGEEGREAIPLRSYVDVRPDSLADLPDGKQLVSLRPSELWRAYGSQAEPGRALDSLQVIVTLPDGRQVTAGLLLLMG